MNSILKMGVSLIVLLTLLPFASAQLINANPTAVVKASVSVPTLVEITAANVVAVDTRLGPDLAARAVVINNMRDRADLTRDRERIEAYWAEERRISEGNEQTRREMLRLGIDREQFERSVPADRRAAVIARINAMRTSELTRIRAHNEARVTLAARMDERARVLDRTEFDSDLDQLIARVELAWSIANREGRTELAAELQVVLDRLNKAKADGTTETQVDRNDTERLTWELHVRRLLTQSQLAIDAAERMETRWAVMSDRVDALDARLHADNRFVSRSEQMVAVIVRLRTKFEASITAVESAQATLASAPTTANARALHSAMIRMSVYGDLLNDALVSYVRFYTWVNTRTDVTDNDVTVMTERIRQVNEDTVVAAEVDAQIAKSVSYGKA